MDEQDVLWSKKFFSTMADGAIWGVPRSGLIFTKKGDCLVLKDRMPFDPSMPCMKDDFVSFQEDDYLTIKAHFEAAGIKVEKDLR